jgi:hypothetical protein
MTVSVTPEKVREFTREEVDQAIEVIERHLEKEAHSLNLLDEQATMRPKDLCKEQGLKLVSELRRLI